MISQQLIDYIKNQQSLGKNKEEITAALLGQGWQAADVEQGFASAASGIPAPMNPELPKARQIFNEAWAIYKVRFKTLIGINLIPMAGFFAFGLLAVIVTTALKDKLHGARFVLIAVGVIIFLALIYLSLWAALATLFAIKDHAENINFKTAFIRSKNKIWPFFLTGLLVGLAVVGGIILLIIPGILFAFWFSQYPFIVIEENLKGTAALKRSKYYVKGRIGQTFGKLFYMGMITLGLSLLLSIVLVILDALGLKMENTAWVKAVFQIIWAPLTTIYGYQLYKHLKATRP